jgi:predicted nucleotidyltransferase
MADKLFVRGLEGFLGGTLDWDSQTFSAALMDLDTADVGGQTDHILDQRYADRGHVDRSRLHQR